MVEWVAAGVILAGVILSQRLYGYLPGSGNYLALEVTDHHRRAQALIEQIPPAARVSAQDRLNPHVSGRETLYIFPRVEDADTVFVDVTGSAWPQHPNELKQAITDLLAADFGVAAAADGYLLLRKGAPDDALPPAFYTAWQQPQSPSARPVAAHATNIVFNDELALLGYGVTTDRYGELVVQMTWQALQPITQPLHFYVAYLDSDLNVLHDSQFYQPTAGLWYPTTMWQPGEPVYVQTLPWTLTAETFVLALGVYTDAAGWNSGSRLPVTQLDPVTPLLEGGALVRLGGFAHAGGGQWTEIAPDAATPGQPLTATFGDAIQLAGATVPPQAQPGTSLPFTLFWQATAPVQGDFNSFVHLLDGAGNKVAQLDWTPHDAISKLPTSAWPVIWPVQDTQTLALPSDLAPGVYTLIVGLYDWQSGDRLPTTGQDAAPGDVVTVGTILVR